METNFKFTSTKEVQNYGINIVVYGQSGTGKTSLAKTIDNCIIVNFEDGLLSLQGTDIPVFTPKSIDELNSFLNYCESNSFPYTTLFLDSITSLAEFFLSIEKNQHKDMRQAYLLMQEYIYAVIKHLVSIKKLNVVLVTQEAKIMDELNGKVLKGLSFPGRNLGSKVPYLVDCVLHLKNDVSRDPKTQEIVKSVYFVTCPTSDEEGKDRTGKLDMFELPDLTNLFNKIRNVPSTNN